MSKHEVATLLSDRMAAHFAAAKSKGKTGKSAPILEIKWLEHGLGLDAPSYESDLAAGMDMRAALPKDAPLSLKPGAQAMIETGFAMALPPVLRRKCAHARGWPPNTASPY